MYFDGCLLPHQRHHHTSQGRCQGLLGEHAKPDIPFKEGGRAEAPGDVLQRGHAQVSGELDPLGSYNLTSQKLRNTHQVWQTRCMFICAQVSADGLQSIPLNLAVSWRCEPTSTDLRIDYKYNGEAMTTPMALNNVQFLIPVDGGVSKLQAVLPPAAWYSPNFS